MKLLWSDLPKKVGKVIGSQWTPDSEHHLLIACIDGPVIAIPAKSITSFITTYPVHKH